MAGIITNDSDIAIGKGDVWDVARDLTAAGVGKLIFASAFTVNAAFGESLPTSIGHDNFISDLTRTGKSVDVNFEAEIDYFGLWLQILANVMGTSPAGVEQTVGQSDYLHNLDLASTNDGKFTTMVYKIEDDAVVEIPSVKWTSCAFRGTASEKPIFSASGLGSRLVRNASVTNTLSEINALTYNTQTFATVGGSATHYFRLNTQSGGALSSSNDLEIMNFEITVTRSFETFRTLRGASTQFIVEPKQNGKTEVMLKFQLSKIDDGVLDGIVAWLDRSEFKAELFMDGAAISGGVNRSLKFQFPRLVHVGQMPEGYDLPGQNTLMQPTFTFRALAAGSAPTGMSGVTNCLRVASINNRNVSYL